MIYRKLRLLSRSQRGFTILEMLVTVALTGIMNSINWISRDAQMAQVIQGAEVFPDSGDLVLTWTTWENDVDRVVYSVSDGQLKRTYTVSGINPLVTVVAYNINDDHDLTHCVFSDGVLSLTITASVGEGSRVADVTCTHDTTSRPNL